MMQQITDEMAAKGAKVLDAVPCLDAANFRQVACDVYAAMSAVGYAEVDRALAELNEPPKPDPEAFAQLGKIMAGKSGVDWSRLEELVKSRLVEVKTVQRPDFGDRGGPSRFYRMTDEERRRYAVGLSRHLKVEPRPWFSFGNGLSTPEATGNDKSSAASDGRG